MADARVDVLEFRLAAIGETLDQALITTDVRGVITSWNRAAERLYGYTSQEMTGQDVAKLIPSDRIAEEHDRLTRIGRGEPLRELNTIRQRKDGTHVPVAVTISPILGSDGNAIGTVRIARDLTDQRHAERAARRLAAIVESSDDAIISKDLNGTVTSWNRAAETMFGYSAAEMVGQSIRLLIPADRQAEEDHVLACVRRGDKVDHFETIRRHKDGSAVHISLTVSPILDQDGTIIGASKSARNISERKRLEAERDRLLAATEQNAAVTEKLNRVGAIVASSLDRDRVVQAVTDAATELTTAEFGVFAYIAIDDRRASYVAHSVSGAPHDAVSTFPVPQSIEELEKAFAAGTAVRTDNILEDSAHPLNRVRLDAPLGTQVRSYLAVPVRARSGDVMGGLFFGHSRIGYFTDQHQRLTLGIASWASIALENARLYITLQETSRLKDEFLATLSHELRTPLNAILGYARMIRSGILKIEKQHKAIETIERNATSLTQIVEDVLDVSRIIGGKMRLNVQPVDLSDVVRHAIETVLPAADAKGIHINAVLSPLAAPISGDAERLQQVVWNLMSNAVKFTGRGGHIHVHLQRVESHVELVINDTGIGIPRSFLPHVFERFRQADAGPARERGGLGLGLGIARQLVELHGGTIEATSAGEGTGSTFSIRLPVAIVHRSRPFNEQSRDRESLKEARLAIPNLQGVRVLAVDDDEDALNMIREILEAAGAEVSTAVSAGQALTALAASPADVLVSDLGMPRMDGFGLISEIRKNNDRLVRDIPAAALTAYARSEDRTRAIRSGFQLHLSKPIDPAELMAAIATLANRTA